MTGEIMLEKSNENNEVQILPPGSGIPRAVWYWSLGEHSEK